MELKQMYSSDCSDYRGSDYTFLLAFFLCLFVSPVLFTVKATFGLLTTIICEAIVLLFGFYNLFIYFKKYKNEMLFVLSKLHWVNITWLISISSFILLYLLFVESKSWIKPFVVFLIFIPLYMIMKYHAVIIGKSFSEIFNTDVIKK